VAHATEVPQASVIEVSWKGNHYRGRKNLKDREKNEVHIHKVKFFRRSIPPPMSPSCARS